MANSIIIPTDGSEYAEKASKVGFDFAEKIDATVHALAVGDVNQTERSAVGGGPPQTVDDVTELAETWAADLAAAAEERGLEATTVVRSGHPAEEITDYAAALDADMIVIGTAGRSGLERRVLGSVTDKVVRTAPVPVVTVRSDGSIDAA
ncbi:universal stress protein [Natrinema versiforme]|nr:universal stress protein [Natrinema versiforme]